MSALGDASAAGPAARSSRSYYGQAVIKEPVWTHEIPWYFFLGGLGGASATLAYACELRGCDVLARRAWAIALSALAASPALLISDLGRPGRFLNMLRMFKVTSPMSVGSWVLAAGGASTGVSALSSLTGRLRWAGRLGKPAAAALGLPVSTYTAALIAQTAVPVWHEARRELPAVFAAGAAISAGAAATVATPVEHARPARRLALLSASIELIAVRVMERRLGGLGESYRAQAAGAYARSSKRLTLTGALLLGVCGRRSRPASVAAGGMLLAGAWCERWSVFEAGLQSARDPRDTVDPQRARVDSGRGHGASTQDRDAIEREA